MASVGQLLTLASVILVLVSIPGPSVIFTVSRALTVGRRGAVLTVVGNAVGAYAQVVAVAFGVAALLERSAQVFTIVKFIGVAYIIYLGVQAIRKRHEMSEALNARIAPVGPARSVWDGFVVGVFNPKSLAFFVIALPQFVNHAAGHVPVQILLLGAMFPLMTLVITSTWGFLAGTARAWLARSPRRLDMIGGVGGLAMIGLGVSLAFTGRKG